MQTAKAFTRNFKIHDQSASRMCSTSVPDLMDNVLLIRKTPKYERLKDTSFI